MTQNGVAARLGLLRAATAAAGADAALITQPENRFYFSGFSGSAGALLITESQAFIATDFRYFEQSGLECPGFELIRALTTVADALPATLNAHHIRRVAFEAEGATFAEVQALQKAAPDVEWLPTNGVGIGLRAVKDAGELDVMRSAIRLADEALAAGVAQVRPGMRELDLAWFLESHMRLHGAQAASFEIIVSCGPNGARPHARAGDGLLVPGEPIVIDMGARMNGYCSDLTRTICLGEPNNPERFWGIYNTVLQAQMTAEAGIRPGMTGVEGDGLARDVIAGAGYGEYFGHSLGHGVGLAIHENPRLSRLYPGALVPGHVVTVEPGIYLPGWGGVRIEDIIFVTENGVEVITEAPKTPIIALN